MTLFTIGPTEMHPETLKIKGTPVPYFRTEEFSELMKETEATLKEIVEANDKTKTVILTASGTAAMEATVMNCFGKKDKVIIVSGGAFGKRFCEICDVHGIAYDAVELEFGEALTSEKLQKFEKKNYSALLVNLNETSTGQLYDLNMLSSFCKKKKMYLVVDAIGAFLADEILFDKNRIDALIFSSQKALALSPGLSIVMISDRLYNEKVAKNNIESFYFDFKKYVNDMERGQTPFTPAVGIIMELHQRLLGIRKTGTDKILEKARRNAEYFRKKVHKLNVKIPDYPLSNAITPIILEDGAYDVFLKLKNDYSLVVTPSGGDLRNKMIRVSHVGNLKKKDFDELIEALEEVL